MQLILVTEAKQVQCVADLACEIWQHHYPAITGWGQTQYMLDNYQSAHAIQQHIAQGHHYYLVLLDQEYIGYFALLLSMPQQRVQLSKIYIKQAYRNQGYGKQIIEFVQTWSQTAGATELWLTVNRHNLHSIAFYLRVGFEIVGEMLQDIGNGFVMDDYQMLMCLSKESSEM